MSKIARYTGNLRAFGSNAQGLERTLFGETTQADDLTSQVTAAFLRGWGIVGPSENPSMEDFNAAMYTMSQFIAYQHQMGVPEWDAAQEYYIGSLCVRAGETYASLANSNINSAPPSAKWTQVITVKNGLTSLGLADGNGYVGRLLNIQTFTSSGTYTPTAGTKKTFREVLGAGGGGGGVSATASGNVAIAAGGGSGAYCAGWVLNPVAAAVTVGVGGTGGIGSTNAAGGGLAGSDGGASTIGALTANGGKGGQGNGTTTITSGTTTLKVGAEGGTATGGDINMKGNASPMSVATTTGNSVSGYGAPSIFGGGNPGGFGTSSNGVDAAALGAGGSGALSTQSPTNLYNGGKGGNGMIRIWEFA